MTSSRTSVTNAGQAAASSGLGGQADISASAAPRQSRSSSRISAAAGLATLPSLRHSVSGAGGGETVRSLSQQYGMAPQQPVPGSSRAGAWRESLGAGGGSGPKTDGAPGMAEGIPSRSAPQEYGMAPDPVPSASLTGEWRESQRGDGSGPGPSANQQAADSAYNGYVQESMRGGSSRVSTLGESKESETLYEDWRHKMRRRSEVGHVDSWGNAYTHSEIEAKNMIHIWTPDGKSDMRGGDYIGYYKFRGSISHDRPVTQETYDLDQQRITQLIEAGDSGLQSDLAKWSRRWWWRVSEKDYEQRMAKLRSRAEESGAD